MGRFIHSGRRITGEYASIDPRARRGRRRIALGCNRQSARHALVHLEDSLAKAEAGLTVTIDDVPLLVRDRFFEECRAAGLRLALAEHAGKPLPDHLEAWHTHLVSVANSADYCRLCRFRVQRIITHAKWIYWVDITAEGVENALSAWRNDAAEQLSKATSNHYLTAMKMFCRWCVSTKRALADPIAHLDALNAKTDPRHTRRPLSPAELTILLQETAVGPERSGVSGRDRAMAYRAAPETGLRANELRTLTVRAFKLEQDPPHVHVTAAYAKGKREDDQPLRPEFVAALKKYFARRDRDAPAFRLPPANRVSIELKRDLRAARAAWLRRWRITRRRREQADPDFLQYEVDGAFADFHSLRHMYITSLARAGVQPKVCQELARHSTITLTMGYYTHTALSDLTAAVEALPAMPDLDATPKRPARETGRETKQAAG